MSEEIEFTTHTFPMLDTGIGREAGYEDDMAFMAAMEAEYAAMSKEQRAFHDRFNAEMDRTMLYGA